MSKDYSKEISDLIIDASKAIGKPIDDFRIVHTSYHELPEPLKDGEMAVYTFVCNDEFLKIGKADKKSKARYQSQHYYTKSARSTLANSLVNDKDRPLINEDNVREWILSNCERFDVIINDKYGPMALDFIEGMLHFKYNPIYEGFNK